MDKCTRCNKIISDGATITINKPVYSARLERFYNICGYCVEELEEFLSKGEETNE